MRISKQKYQEMFSRETSLLTQVKTLEETVNTLNHELTFSNQSLRAVLWALSMSQGDVRRLQLKYKEFGLIKDEVKIGE